MLFWGKMRTEVSICVENWALCVSAVISHKAKTGAPYSPVVSNQGRNGRPRSNSSPQTVQSSSPRVFRYCHCTKTGSWGCQSLCTISDVLCTFKRFHISFFTRVRSRWVYPISRTWCQSARKRFASHDDIFDCRGSKRSGRLYFCSGPYLIVPTIEWQIQQLSGYANMILYLQSVDRGLALAHKWLHRSSMAARISWINLSPRDFGWQNHRVF